MHDLEVVGAQVLRSSSMKTILSFSFMLAFALVCSR
jgi:hypothetical protein